MGVECCGSGLLLLLLLLRAAAVAGCCRLLLQFIVVVVVRHGFSNQIVLVRRFIFGSSNTDSTAGAPLTVSTGCTDLDQITNIIIVVRRLFRQGAG